MEPKVKKPNESRDKLKELTQYVKPLVTEGKYININEALINEVYKIDISDKFLTFKKWLELGYKVRKGSKGYPIWSKPKNILEQQKGKEPNPEDTNIHFMCYVFSNRQVDKI